jgi:hypothetical protein
MSLIPYYNGNHSNSSSSAAGTASSFSPIPSTSFFYSGQTSQPPTQQKKPQTKSFSIKKKTLVSSFPTSSTSTSSSTAHPKNKRKVNVHSTQKDDKDEDEDNNESEDDEDSKNNSSSSSRKESKKKPKNEKVVSDVKAPTKKLTRAEVDRKLAILEQVCQAKDEALLMHKQASSEILKAKEIQFQAMIQVKDENIVMLKQVIATLEDQIRENRKDSQLITENAAGLAHRVVADSQTNVAKAMTMVGRDHKLLMDNQKAQLAHEKEKENNKMIRFHAAQSAAQQFFAPHVWQQLFVNSNRRAISGATGNERDEKQQNHQTNLEQMIREHLTANVKDPTTAELRAQKLAQILESHKKENYQNCDGEEKQNLERLIHVLQMDHDMNVLSVTRYKQQLAEFKQNQNQKQNQLSIAHQSSLSVIQPTAITTVGSLKSVTGIASTPRPKKQSSLTIETVS